MINESAVGSYDFDYDSLSATDQPYQIPGPLFCIKRFKDGSTYPFNDTYQYDTHLIVSKLTFFLAL